MVMTGRYVAVACAAALLAGCSGSGPEFAARQLRERLQTKLTPQVAANQAGIQRQRDGAVVTLNEPALFAVDSTDLTPEGRYTLASLTEALLDPRLMQISVRGGSGTTELLADQRAQTVENFVEAYSLGPPLPMTAQPRPAAVAGLTVEIRVVCPPGPQGSTWGYEVPRPTCD
jgi:outer membrane protein OmpA-like peptidoglycan-associated protein